MPVARSAARCPVAGAAAARRRSARMVERCCLGRVRRLPLDIDLSLAWLFRSFPRAHDRGMLHWVSVWTAHG